MSDKSKDHDQDKVAVTLPGTVKKVIPLIHPGLPEKAEISVEGADELYREIRVENALNDEHGNEVSLKPGAEVQVISKLMRTQRTITCWPLPKCRLFPNKLIGQDAFKLRRAFIHLQQVVSARIFNAANVFVSAVSS
jgi:hypothetical protein